MMVPQFTFTADVWMALFCLFNNEKDALEFFQSINGKHTNISFTMETDIKHKLPFLDMFS